MRIDGNEKKGGGAKYLVETGLSFIFVLAFLALLAKEGLSINTQDMSVSANIISQQNEVQSFQDMDFGQLRPDQLVTYLVVVAFNTGTQVWERFVDDNGTQLFVHPVLAATAFSQAGVSVSGPAGNGYQVILPPFFVVHDDSDGSDSLRVDQLTAVTQSLGPGTTGQFGADGLDLLEIGGTAEVTAGVKSGKYTGNLAITVVF